MQAPIEAISSAAANPAARAYGQLPDVQAVDMAALAASAAPAAPAATATGGSGFASLAMPAAAPAFTAGAEWNRTLSTVSDAFTQGLNRPHLKEMESLLSQAVTTGQPASPEHLMLVGLRLQEGTAVTSFLSQAVNNTRQSLQTLIERS